MDFLLPRRQTGLPKRTGFCLAMAVAASWPHPAGSVDRMQTFAATLTRRADKPWPRPLNAPASFVFSNRHNTAHPQGTVDGASNPMSNPLTFGRV